jgi:hypothetical protein
LVYCNEMLIGFLIYAAGVLLVWWRMLVKEPEMRRFFVDLHRKVSFPEELDDLFLAICMLIAAVGWPYFLPREAWRRWRLHRRAVLALRIAAKRRSFKGSAL